MTIEFNDPDLKRVYEENRRILDSNIEMLNKLSFDIKQIDAILSTKGCKSRTVALKVVSGSLLWCGEYVMFISEDISRRLLECPKEIRIMCKPYLATFFELCIQKIGEI